MALRVLGGVGIRRKLRSGQLYGNELRCRSAGTNPKADNELWGITNIDCLTGSDLEFLCLSEFSQTCKLWFPPSISSQVEWRRGRSFTDSQVFLSYLWSVRTKIPVNMFVCLNKVCKTKHSERTLPSISLRQKVHESWTVLLTWQPEQIVRVLPPLVSLDTIRT